MASETTHSKFVHSIPVPQIYKVASKILQKHLDKEGSIKSLLNDYVTKSNRRTAIQIDKLYGILMKTQYELASIQNTLEMIDLFKIEPKFSKSMAYILTSELLVRGGMLPHKCKPVQVLNGYAHDILTHFKPTIQDKVICPRYIRVNTLLVSTKKVCKEMRKEGWRQVKYDSESTSYTQYLELVDSLSSDSYIKDYHIKDVLAFPPKTSFHKTNLYKDNKIIIQDKASCIPVAVSSIQAGDSVIDACAAPGNKTSQVASANGNAPGSIIAVELNEPRYKLLCEFMESWNVNSPTILHKNFLHIEPKEYENVKVILLDPTCSASGTSSTYEMPPTRLHSMVKIQRQLLCHALAFPVVKTVVYSTCSVLEEENEQVVQFAYEQYSDTYEIEDLSVKLKGWEVPGLEKYEFGKKCIRTDSRRDKCLGFFVAVFMKKTKNNVKSKKQKRKIDVGGNIDIDECGIGVKDEIKGQNKCKRKKIANYDLDVNNSCEVENGFTSITKNNKKKGLILKKYICYNDTEAENGCEIKVD